MDTTEKATQLFHDYCYYREQTANLKKIRQDKPFLQQLKPTSKRLELLVELIAWCKEKRVEPRLWLYSLFTTRRWMFAPKLEKGHLLSENHLSKFQKLKNLSSDKFYRRYIDAQKNCSPPDESVYDPNRDLSTTVEQAKGRYLRFGDSAVCMGQMEVETFGYHPKSMFCVHCPSKQECRAKLEATVRFDIVALRLGKITSQDAHQQALNRMQGYGG